MFNGSVQLINFGKALQAAHCSKLTSVTCGAYTFTRHDDKVTIAIGAGGLRLMALYDIGLNHL